MYSQVLFMQFILLIAMLLISGSNGSSIFQEKINVDVINKICSQVSNKNYCLGILNSDSRVKTADVKGVAGILVQQAYFDASALNNKATLLAKKETNPQIKQRYSVIASYLQTITGRLSNAKTNLMDTNNIYIQADASLAKIYSCEDLFLYPAPKESTDLPQKIKNLDDLLNMIMADVNLIPK